MPNSLNSLTIKVHRFILSIVYFLSQCSLSAVKLQSQAHASAHACFTTIITVHIEEEILSYSNLVV